MKKRPRREKVEEGVGWLRVPVEGEARVGALLMRRLFVRDG